MKKIRNRLVCMVLSAAMLFPQQVWADSTETVVTPQETQDPVVIEQDDRPYLSLGADLTKEQQATVLNLMGIKEEELSGYNVSYVTNAEEHTYLDAYISSNKIGTRAWSSVVIVKREKGNGIQISTKNITYCTISMYKNALVTAGVADADIIVAGPQPISGTAALVGVLKAYTDMTGDEIPQERMDTALNELVLTGELRSVAGANGENVEEMVAYLKQKVAEGALTDENSIQTAIEDACKDFDISLTDEQKSELIDLMLKIKDLNLDVDSLIEQAQSVYDNLSGMGFDCAKGEGIAAKFGSFFSDLIASIKEFFAGLFG